MREIEFRGKTTSEVWGGNQVKDGIWVYGFYRDKVGLPVISQFEIDRGGDYIDYEIDRNTLGQYIGLKDKNGKKIFEGDIISSNHYPFIDGNKQNYVGVIEYIPELASFQYILNCVNPDKNGISNGINEQLEANDNLIVEDFEVIGNIWDNGDLINEN